MMASPTNCKVFKEYGGSQVLYIILEYPSTRQYATGKLFVIQKTLFIKGYIFIVLFSYIKRNDIEYWW